MGLVVRPATTRDAKAISRIGVRSWREGFRGLVPEEVTPERAWDPYRVAARLETAGQGPTVTLIAERDGEPAGFLIHGPSRDDGADPGTGEIWVLYVDPDHWRAGVGRFLVEAAPAGLRAEGFREATVWTLAESERNLAFYEALGFRTDGATQRREAFGRTAEARLRTPLT